MNIVFLLYRNGFDIINIRFIYNGSPGLETIKPATEPKFGKGDRSAGSAFHHNDIIGAIFGNCRAIATMDDLFALIEEDEAVAEGAQVQVITTTRNDHDYYGDEAGNLLGLQLDETANRTEAATSLSTGVGCIQARALLR